MKFVHIADMHFDMPFTSLNNINGLGELRRLEQRKVFKEIIEYIIKNEIEYLFISGDLYEHEYVRLSTIEYINNLFYTIPNTKIFISPGNHDPYLVNSYYNKFNWCDNVYILNSKVKRYEFKDIDIYGFGFEDFYMLNTKINEIQIKDKNKINILITHGSLDEGGDEYRQYNPMSKKELKELGFDYIALGHIHKLNYQEDKNQRIVYPGSTISLGFDELGQHGIISGYISKSNLNIELIPFDKKEFKEKEINISTINSQEELIEYLNNLKLPEQVYYKIILKGNKNFEINIYKILKYISNENIIKIKNNTEEDYDLEKIKNENNLKGIFVNELLELIKKEEKNKDKILTAINIGLDNLENKR